MSDLIIYNYSFSPFSEKIRTMLGYAGLPWNSVTVSPMPPRPELDALAGGYRKIPVGQIGADVYCDTKTIASEIARLCGKPELAIENCLPEVQAFATKTDLEFFLACTVVAGPGIVLGVLKETSLLNTVRLLKDRIGFARKAKVKPVSGKQAKELVHNHIAEMEKLLTDDFLFGDQPCAADFSAYHCLWFGTKIAGRKWLAERPRLSDWYARMQAFGHGALSQMTADQALDIARDSKPAALGDLAVAQPTPATIAPQDYALDPLSGSLVGEHEHGWVLQREHPRVGTVNVHFPKEGYEMSRQT